MKMNLTVILTLCICVVLCSAGCVTAAKNLLKPPATPIPIPTPNLTVNLTPPVSVSQPVLYIEGQDEYMFRTSGHWLGDWVQYKRDNVEGLKDIDMRATVYRAFFLPNYRYWSVSWGQYFPQAPNQGMKYLVVFARIYLEGNDQEKDPRMWGPGQDHFSVQVDDTIYPVDSNHVIGYRIKELENYWDYDEVSRIFDYGYFRYYDTRGVEQAGDLGYIRMGKSNAWDGYMLFEVPMDTELYEIKVLERIDGIGNVWWYPISKPL